MYQPPHFREDRSERHHELIRSHPLGMLVSHGPSGLVANPVPFLLDPEASERGTLRTHLSRANPQWRDLAGAQECLVVFQGPQAYVTPSWYPTKQETGKVVPTWNYATVHVWGRPRVVENETWLRSHLEELTSSQERRRAAPWTVDDAPPAFVAAQIKGIVGIEVPIARSEGKWKVSQNRSEADRLGVARGLREERDSEAMAVLVADRGG